MSVEISLKFAQEVEKMYRWNLLPFSFHPFFQSQARTVSTTAQLSLFLSKRRLNLVFKYTNMRCNAWRPVTNALGIYLLLVLYVRWKYIRVRSSVWATQRIPWTYYCRLRDDPFQYLNHGRTILLHDDISVGFYWCSKTDVFIIGNGVILRKWIYTTLIQQEIDLQLQSINLKL